MKYFMFTLFASSSILISLFPITTRVLAQNTDKGSERRCYVTDKDGNKQLVSDLRLNCPAFGNYVGFVPKQSNSLSFKIEKKHVEVVIQIELQDVTSIQFVKIDEHNLKFTAELRDSTSWEVTERHQAIHKTKLRKDKFNTVGFLNFCEHLICDDDNTRVKGKRIYNCMGFVGIASVDGSTGKFTIELDDVRKIEFVD